MVVLDLCKSKKFNLIRLINSKGAWHLTGDQIQLKGMMRKAHAPSMLFNSRFQWLEQLSDLMKMSTRIIN
jgi:hypothetical protein